MSRGEASTLSCRAHLSSLRQRRGGVANGPRRPRRAPPCQQPRILGLGDKRRGAPTCSGPMGHAGRRSSTAGKEVLTQGTGATSTRPGSGGAASRRAFVAVVAFGAFEALEAFEALFESLVESVLESLLQTLLEALLES